MNDTVKPTGATRIVGKRKHLRASTRESATLILDGIGEIAGHADDIGFGGVFFTSDHPLEHIPVNSAGTITFTMFNTLVDMNCKVASCRNGGLGIEIQRYYSMEDLKEKVRNISTDTPTEKIKLTDDAVSQLLYQTAAFLHQLADPSSQGYSKTEADLLADKTDRILAALTTD
ncbi:MAG: hypothetical protein HW380_1415 [Magnetococcales bacterium]|nr:hypothetical protein [Magnetococcales bacterium]HIJ85421.1 PilZ domain-containing protein [Magnetococcales bacterium]